MAEFGLFVSCLGAVLVAGLVLTFLLIWRYISYRENMAYAEKGLLPPQRPSNGKGALIWGILITGVGLALCLGLWILGLGSNYYPLGLGPWMVAGLLPLFFGLALILVYMLTRKDEHPAEPSETPPVLE